MTKFENFLSQLRGKRVAVIGIGVSNTPLLRLLLSAGAHVTACDRKNREALGALAGELEAAGAYLKLGDRYLDELGGAELIFRTPGLRPDTPQLCAARARGAVVTSEMETFFEVCPCTMLAVTGSDGKTTTTTLIAEMLKNAGNTVWLGGNIGAPLLADTGRMKPEDFAVLELSSFQLMTMTRSPHVAVITNLSPNHLDYHLDMAEYVEAKTNIFSHQSTGDVLVLNADNAETAALAARAHGEVRLFSRASRPEDGVSFDGATLFAERDGTHTPLFARPADRLRGLHNVENMMAACAAVRDYVPAEVMAHTVETFAGIEHRCELVRVLDGVSYYNDSIASSPTRCAAGLVAFEQKVILIAGGYDKHIPFDELGFVIRDHVKLLLLCGATAEAIEHAVRAAGGVTPPIVRCEKLEECVSTARASALPGDIVTLSPACASFDQFPNFMKRGEYFKERVHELK
ncbi:MAG: UDP-N-acetylmuramoylalanine--D-glutamate ligase [Clostridium sp. SCN 57-10]|nr:MAG: UDP-N-acetylmuramoylalanine--D-glutamate ligase [Clostridium sp. SCN 57-10]